MKMFTLNEVKDMHIGKAGTPERTKYERELQINLLGDLIQEAREKQGLTQEELGKLVGLNAIQIASVEEEASKVTLGIILKVFTALKASLSFKVEWLESKAA